MPIIDLHCDTMTELKRQNKGLARNDANVDIEKMLSADVMCQFFAIFVKLTEYADCDEAWEYMENIYKFYVAEMEANKDKISQAISASDIVANRATGKISGLLTIEEGGILDGKHERLEELYNKGVRLITLTWNYENTLGYPNSDDKNIMNSGLKPFGKDIVKEMCHRGMIVDVSHLSDGGFWDVVELCDKPFIASHTNARAITNFRRNITDEMIKALADKGGVMGINFYSLFLGLDGSGSVAQMIEHIKHIRNIGGIDVLAIGSDFDGFSGNCEIHDSSELVKLVSALKAEKFTDEEIDKITYKNAMRVIDEVLK